MLTLLSLYSVLFYHYDFCFTVCLECVLLDLLCCHFHLHEISFSVSSLSICVSLALRWVSYRQQAVGSFLFLNPVCHCLFIRVFSPLTFKVIIDRYVFISIFKPYFPVEFIFLLCSFLFFLFLFDGFLLYYTFFFSFTFCEPVTWFWFMVTLAVKCVNPQLYWLALDW